MKSAPLLVLPSFLLVAGCSAPDVPNPDDGGSTPSSDAANDTGPDASSDTGMDGTIDSGLPEGSSPDGSPDATPPDAPSTDGPADGPPPPRDSAPESGTACMPGDTCDDGNACTTGDRCDPTGMCVGTQKDCSDNRTCTVDSCDPHTGACSSDTSACLCNSAPDCDDRDPCTQDSCDLSGNTCSHAPQAGPACDDGNACTTGDTCQANGSCAGTPKTCDDGNDCTTDACTSSGACTHTAVVGKACDDNSMCTTTDQCHADGSCAGIAVACDDGNPCTDDSCAAATGCAHTANTASCDDKGACTTGDVCSATVCAGAPVSGCSIGNDHFDSYGGSQGYAKAQSFVAPAATISKIDLYTPTATSSSWEVRILSDLPTPLASGDPSPTDRDAKTLDFAIVPSASVGWVTFTFSPPLTVNTGHVYYIFVDVVSTFGTISNGNWQEGMPGTDPYPDGSGYLCHGSWLTDVGVPAGTWDYAFHVYP